MRKIRKNSLIGSRTSADRRPGHAGAGRELASRGLRPIGELSATRGHGDRLRYMAGCRCSDCRAANSRYECERRRARKAGDWNGIVPAARARRHICKLKRLGVGRRMIAAASDVNQGTVHAIAMGRKRAIRARTERRVLAVTERARGDAALVPARRTWRLIGRLMHEGFTKAELARRLGYRMPALQFNRERVTARTAWTVECLYERLMK